MENHPNANPKRARISKMNTVAYAIILGLGVFAGKSIFATPQNTVLPTPKERIVASFGDRQITLSEVDGRYEKDLFELRAKALHEIITEELLARDAAEKGLTSEQFRDKEFSQKVPEPTREEIEVVFNRAQREGQIAPNATYEQEAPRLKAMLRQGQIAKMEREYSHRLVIDNGVKIDLDGIGRRKLQLRSGGPAEGATSPKVVIHEYTDFQSHYCATANKTVMRILKEYGASVKVYFRQNPQPGNQYAQKAAEAALCAHDQGRYSVYRDTLFENQDELTEADLVSYALTVGLDEGAFKKCLQSGEKRAVVLADMEEARENEIEGEPAFSVNGTILSGAHSFSMFQELIEIELPKGNQ